MFDRFLNFLNQYAERQHFPYKILALYLILNYATVSLWFSYIVKVNENPLFKIEMIKLVLCIILFFKEYWPNKLKKFYVLYWYVLIVWCLSYSGTFSFLHYPELRSVLIPLDALFIVFLLILSVDWLSFIIVLFIGILLAFLVQRIFYGDYAPIIISSYTSFIYYTISAVFLGVLFSRNTAKAWQNVRSQQQEIANISAQVAHDIRSPLAALQILTEQQLLELPESKRILLRDAVHQIRDITNNLDKNAIKNEKTITQVAVLLENVLSERRAAFVNKPITFIEHIPLEAYSYFASIIPSEIKRVITNIINNAVEAMNDREGIVNIDIKASGNNIVIEIADNGAGIPKATLDALFARGFTTKKTGSGLGLFHAKETLKKLGGDIHMNSEVGKGTTVSLLIQLCEVPEWFIDTLSIPDHSILVCVDDSVSIWNAWQERFKAMTHEIDLRYCEDKEALLMQLREQSDKPYTYLIDYEFSGKLYTGLDLIKLVLKFKKPNDQVYLVTSRSGEANVHQFCSEHQVKLIPKFFALKIPLVVI
jgi:signal transduction histidine kinase